MSTKICPAVLIFIVTVLITGSVWPCEAGDTFKELDENWRKVSNSVDDAWQKSEKSFSQRWKRMNARIMKKWETAFRSTRRDWVYYDRSLDKRSRVDFKSGKILLEVVIPESRKNKLEKAEKALKSLGLDVFSRKDGAGMNILGGQIRDKKGVRTDETQHEEFLDEEVLPDVTSDSKPYLPGDGIKRRVYSVEISLVPEHLQVRAERYLPLVEKYALKNKIDPALVLAVIHTESYFNPKAVSSCKAIGLMQIIPEFAGRETQRYLYHKDLVPEPEFYFDPEKNIEAGCTYLNILSSRYFEKIRDRRKNLYLSICGYNWGPSKMRVNIVERYNINRMTDSEVYGILRSKTPEETRNYIKKVIKRTDIYKPYSR